MNFYSSRFEDFKPNHSYDIIFSLANDETIDGNTKFTFEEYIQKIYNSLNENGGLIIGEDGKIEGIGKKVNTNNIPSRTTRITDLFNIQEYD